MDKDEIDDEEEDVDDGRYCVFCGDLLDECDEPYRTPSIGTTTGNPTVLIR